MIEVKFNGRIYRSDGINIYRNGQKIANAPQKIEGSIKKIKALLFDGKIFYDGNIYKKKK